MSARDDLPVLAAFSRGISHNYAQIVQEASDALDRIDQQPTLMEVGIDYCITHAGTRNDDELTDRCDWYDRRTDHKATDAPCELVPLAYVVKP